MQEGMASASIQGFFGLWLPNGVRRVLSGDKGSTTKSKTSESWYFFTSWTPFSDPRNGDLVTTSLLVLEEIRQLQGFSLNRQWECPKRQISGSRETEFPGSWLVDPGKLTLAIDPERQPGKLARGSKTIYVGFNISGEQLEYGK